MISLGTVYKTLEKFYEVGLIQKVSPITEVARYDAITGPHHHMVCLECQSIWNASLAEEPAITVSGQDGFRILRQQVVFQGIARRAGAILIPSLRVFSGADPMRERPACPAFSEKNDLVCVFLDEEGRPLPAPSPPIWSLPPDCTPQAAFQSPILARMDAAWYFNEFGRVLPCQH